MSRLLCINAVGLGDYVTMPLGAGQSTVDYVDAFARNVPDVGRVVVLTEPGGKNPFAFDSAEVPERTGRALIGAFDSLAAGFSEIVYIFGDTPFLDSDITARMIENHGRYFAEYSFADGYPYGITPEVVSTSVVQLLKRLVEQHDVPLNRETLFAIVQTDINSFDIETDISPVDLRSLRISLTADNRRNYLVCKRIAEGGAENSESILRTVQERGQLLRTLPAYINVQIIDGCPQACSYCPFPRFGGNILENRSEMSTAVFRTLMEQVAAFAPGSTINLSLWGEPSLHSEIAELILTVDRSQTLSLNVETSGIGWDTAVLDRLSAAGLDKTEWIVSLDANEPALYRTLRGPGQDEALTTAGHLLERFPGHVHIQAVRMTENEEHLESFYRSWKERTGKVIIQKYDDFAGFLPAKKVTDLSPLKREPCWHLKRDMVVLLDGTVPVCREDIHRRHILGNALTEDLETIWARGEEIYANHLHEDYPDICRSCDEYYTYNY